MNLRVSLLVLMGAIAIVKCDQRLLTLAPDLLSTGFEVIRDLFNILFGKVITFRHVLTLASNVVGAFFSPDPIPPIPEPWWGEHPADTTIRPFRVHFTDEMISDLRRRIADQRKITPSLSGAANSYGINADVLAQLLHYWAHEYDFKKREDWLNSFPQYNTIIQGLSIHFIHVKPLNPHGKRVVPLLLVHGWPANAFLFTRAIQHLMAEQQSYDFVFEIVVPDLPGFGYSDATSKIGLSDYQMGIIMKNLMDRLGLPRFYTNAGGLGQFFAAQMAVLFPESVLGVHTTLAFSLRPQTLVKWFLGQLYPPAVVEAQYEDRMYPLSKQARFYLENFGYLHIHATRPDNVAHGADDSPVALLSWIVGTMLQDSEFSKNRTDGNSMAELFDTCTIFWAAQCMTTGIRVYAESLAFVRDPLLKTLAWTPTSVPVSVLRFRSGIIYQPDDFIRDKYPNLVQSTTLDFGGHFSSQGQTKTLTDHIWLSVQKMEQFHRARGYLTNKENHNKGFINPNILI